MRRITKTSWILLFYWVPLVNLGPSLHHSDFFGFHSHACGSSHCHHSPASGASHCSSDRSHTHSSVGCHSHSKTENSDTHELFIAGTDGDCSLCQFFDQYNVVFSCIDFQPQITISYQRSQLDTGMPGTALLAASARAPPFFFHMG